MTKLLRAFAIKPVLLTLMVTLGSVLFIGGGRVVANEPVDVAVNIALEAAKTHTPGKVVAHEKADEMVGNVISATEIKTLQPVYRIKILSPQGVMKTLLVHRQTGKVVE